MSGLQRRNKRSHDADAAEPGSEGQAAVPESAPTPAEAAGGSDAAPAPGEDAPTQQLPVTAAEEAPAAPAGEAAERTEAVPAERAEAMPAAPAEAVPAERAAATPAEPAGAVPAGETAPGDPELAALVKGTRGDEGAGRGDEGAPGAGGLGAEAPTGVAAADAGDAVTGSEGAERKRRIPRLRRKRRTALIEEPFPQPLDPNMPAGLEPAELSALPPAGRRGRLRRRLRYLRRARELMLRDLGGLVFEIHRTAGGDVTAHRAVLGAKVQRIANVDREAHAIEDALSAPRGDAVVFQPGIGGTCPVCSELYGSAARFCANCGTPLGATPAVAGPTPVEPAGPAPVRTPAAPPVPAAPAAHAPLGLAPAPRPAEPESAREPDPEPRTQPLANGRPNPDTTPPELSSGDPLAARERP
jgi:hypothetical protein